MIQSIRIAGVASYGSDQQVLADLSKFNFCYGSNGTGKTTISRVIADEQRFPTCDVNWQRGTRLQTMVYNRDFVTNNFTQSAELKGIFTLGDKSIDTLQKITSAKAKFDTLTKTIEHLTKTLQGEDNAGGIKGELTAVESEFRARCWKQKQKHDPKLRGAFEGFRNSADRFRDEILIERACNSATLEPLPDLEKRAETAFGPAPTAEPFIVAVDTTELIAIESNPILSKRVIGRTDVDIAAMIQKLGNSDWVRKGLALYEEANERRCPFCQQSMSDALAQNLKEYFDEAFERDSKAIEDLAATYRTNTQRVHLQLDSLLGLWPTETIPIKQFH